MYSFLKGKIENIEQNKISIDVRDVGYEINMPQNEVEKLKIEEEVKIYTYLHVREDDMRLFGFLERANLDLFKKLILVSGVGPKVALGIIGSISSEDICIAIATENISILKSIPGVGPKMAQKIIFELKDKILKEQMENVKETKIPKNDEAKNEALTALQVLGYSKKQVLDVFERLDLSCDTVEDIIRKALNEMQK